MLRTIVHEHPYQNLEQPYKYITNNHINVSRTTIENQEESSTYQEHEAISRVVLKSKEM